MTSNRTRTDLLTREQFRKRVFARDGGRCVLCGEAAVDPHHVMERKLFADGGYYLDNGASVCGRCHLLCETTEIPVEDVRRAAGITEPVMPPGYLPDRAYDKWGNRIHPDGTRTWGPLKGDEGMLKAIGARRWAIFRNDDPVGTA